MKKKIEIRILRRMMLLVAAAILVGEIMTPVKTVDAAKKQK